MANNSGVVTGLRMCFSKEEGIHRSNGYRETKIDVAGIVSTRYSHTEVSGSLGESVWVVMRSVHVVSKLTEEIWIIRFRYFPEKDEKEKKEVAISLCEAKEGSLKERKALSRYIGRGGWIRGVREWKVKKKTEGRWVGGDRRDGSLSTG